MSETEKRRAIVYVDGFNLFYGMKELRFKNVMCYYWLNLRQMVLEMLPEDHDLVQIKYFSSPVQHDFDKAKRQETYFNALKTLEAVQITLGFFDAKPIHCFQCGNVYYAYVEKTTDVAIGIHLLTDVTQCVATHMTQRWLDFRPSDLDSRRWKRTKKSICLLLSSVGCFLSVVFPQDSARAPSSHALQCVVNM